MDIAIMGRHDRSQAISRGVVVVGDIIKPDPNVAEEDFRVQIEDSLHEITQRADAHWRAI